MPTKTRTRSTKGAYQAEEDSCDREHKRGRVTGETAPVLQVYGIIDARAIPSNAIHRTIAERTSADTARLSTRKSGTARRVSRIVLNRLRNRAKQHFGSKSHHCHWIPLTKVHAAGPFQDIER